MPGMAFVIPVVIVSANAESSPNASLNLAFTNSGSSVPLTATSSPLKSIYTPLSNVR